MTTLRNRLIAVILLGGISGVAGFYLAGTALIAPAPSVVGPPPSDLPVQTVTFENTTGETLAGWLIASDTSCAGVVLMHGIRENRRAMQDRARFLFAAGYDVLLFDFQGHGESSGGHMTFGHGEKADATAAVAFLKGVAPGRDVAVIGKSLGGAAAVLSGGELNADAVVLEAVYPAIERALVNRLRRRIGPFGNLAAPGLLMQLSLRLGFGPEALRPIESIAALGAPLLVIAGSKDRKTTEQDSRDLFAAAVPPKEFWMIEGAAHEDFHRFAGADYERRLLAFLQAHLACPSD